MKTITFYSYKGGVGRSLALSNVAVKLSEFKKKVCVLDFDLEAPGLQFKFKNYTRNVITKGIVDYISEYTQGGFLPQEIKQYSLKLSPSNKNYESIDFIPAGNVDDNSYWKKLSAINWQDMFFNKHSDGIRFFLDLKAKIENELRPDFLLIDSRTGITDIAGITLRILADEVVILSAHNSENLIGSRKIITTLLNPENKLFGKDPKITPVLTRIPFPEEDSKRTFTVKTQQIVQTVEKEFAAVLNKPDFKLLVIHSEPKLEAYEQLLIGDLYDDNRVSISNDYYRLFEEIVNGELLPEELDEFAKNKRAERLFRQSELERNSSKRKGLLDQAIENNSTRAIYWQHRGYVNGEMNNFDQAISDLTTAISLNPTDSSAYNTLGQIYARSNQKIEAKQQFYNALKINPKDPHAAPNLSRLLLLEENFEQVIDTVEKYPQALEDSDLCNRLSNYYRETGKLDTAIHYIYKAIVLAPDVGIYYGTLAEIKADQNLVEEFYLNLAIALSKGLTAGEMATAKEVYRRFREEVRFKELLLRHAIDVDEVFEDWSWFKDSESFDEEGNDNV